MSDIDIGKIRAETPGVGVSTHLLASGSAMMPQPVVDAIVEHTLLEAQIGGYEAHARKSAELDRVYDSVAGHIGATPCEIALMENATVAWCHAFYALPLRPGSRILTCEAEYAANYVAFLQRAKRENLRIEVIPSDETGALDLAALSGMMDDDVGLIAITWVPTNGGLVNPATEVGKIARAHGVPYLLDACQAAGQMRIDVAELGCDFLSATGRKFLRGPRGTGFLYVKADWLASLEPAMIDHFGAPWVARDRYELRDDARRFETWENAYALRAGLGAAIDYADGIGIERIAARVSALASQTRELLSDVRGVTLRDIGQHRCGIVSFSVEDHDPRTLVGKMSEAGFAIGASSPSSTRIDAERRNLPTLLRIAPHYYNTEDEIARAVETLRTLLQPGRSPIARSTPPRAPSATSCGADLPRTTARRPHDPACTLLNFLQGEPTMKIGILGAATLGQFLARRLADAGHDVVLANSRGPESLRETVASLGPRVSAGQVAEALESPVVILGVPWMRIREVLRPEIDWDARVLIDATNIFRSYAPDFDIDDLGEDTGSEIVARLAPTARVVKAFNTLPVEVMMAPPPTDGLRRVLFMAGDDPDAIDIAQHLIADMQFHPVPVGDLATGGSLMELGGSLSGLELLAADPEQASR